MSDIWLYDKASHSKFVNPASGKRSDIRLRLSDTDISHVAFASGERSDIRLLSKLKWVTGIFASGERSDIWLLSAYISCKFVNPASGERSTIWLELK